MVAADRRYELPPGRRVRRAREWRLFDDRGARYADFWQADGAAFLGHRPHGLAALVQREIDRGLWIDGPTAWRTRSDAALARLADRSGVPRLTLANTPWTTDPARWLPLSGSEPEPRETRTVIAPFPAALAVDWRGSVVLQAAITRSLDLLTAYLDSEEARARHRLAASIPAPLGYTRSGVWLLPGREASAAGAYGENRLRALGRGVLLPPDPLTPIAIPGELGRTERAAWEDVCREWRE